MVSDASDHPSAREKEKDKIRALDAGANDYLLSRSAGRTAGEDTRCIAPSRYKSSLSEPVFVLDTLPSILPNAAYF